MSGDKFWSNDADTGCIDSQNDTTHPPAETGAVRLRQDHP